MWKCPICGREFSTLYGLKAHFANKHRYLKTCPVCGREFRSPLSLVQHLRQKFIMSGDEPHGAWWWLMTYSRNRTHGKKIHYKRARSAARVMFQARCALVE
mgnify:CR=1 FL=1